MILDVKEIPKLNLKDKVVGLTSGCFDLIHYYHLHYLERCKAECDVLLVGVDSDGLLNHFKQKNANIPEHHRVAMISALRCVDAAFIMRTLGEFEFAVQFSQKLFKNQPELYGKPVVGADKVELVIIPDIAEVTSTSQIVLKIRS